MPSTPNNSSVRVHHDAPGPHVTVTHARPALDSIAWSLLIFEAPAPSRPRATPWTRTPRDGSPGFIYESQEDSDGDVENP
jgi:hypothetical protein